MSLILINSIYKSAGTPFKDILMVLIWSELCRALIYTTNGPNPSPPPTHTHGNWVPGTFGHHY